MSGLDIYKADEDGDNIGGPRSLLRALGGEIGYGLVEVGLFLLLLAIALVVVLKVA